MYYDNFSSLLTDLDNDFELMDEIIKDLELLIEETKVNIAIGLEKPDYKFVAQAIHKLKGALLNFRVTKEVELLDSMENECKAGRIDSIESNFIILYKNLIQLSLDYRRYQKDNKLA